MPCFTDSTCYRAFPQGQLSALLFSLGGPIFCHAPEVWYQRWGGVCQNANPSFRHSGSRQFQRFHRQQVHSMLKWKGAEEKLKAKSRRKRAKDHISRGCPVFEGSQFRWFLKKLLFKDKQGKKKTAGKMGKLWRNTMHVMSCALRHIFLLMQNQKACWIQLCETCT